MEKWPRIPYWHRSPNKPYGSGVAVHSKHFLNKEIVITEKLDGSNTKIAQGQVFTRSGDNPKASWNGLVKKYHAWKTTEETWRNTIFFGENLYPIHSIEYDAMRPHDTFRLFAIWDFRACLPWDTTLQIANQLCIPTVPQLYRGTIYLADQLEELILSFHKEPSLLGGEREGVVIRTAGYIQDWEFPTKIAKSVRPDHVQTDEHWSRSWLPCKLLTNGGNDD